MTSRPFHYEQLVRENLEAGMAEREARQAASRALGNVALLAESAGITGD